MDGPGVQNTQPRQRRADRRPIRVAEELIGATDDQHRQSRVCRRPQDRSFPRPQVLGEEPLLTVLPPAHEDEIEALVGQVVADPERPDHEVNPPPSAALAQADDITTVGVDVHEVGIEMGEGQAQLAHAALQ